MSNKMNFGALGFLGVLVLLVAASAALAFGQEAQPVANTAAPIPHVIRYSGTADPAPGATLTVKFALYENQTGGEALWSETQQVTPAESGKYSVLLGSATENGLPQTVFNSAQAKWLGITVSDGQESPRTLLVATPYSLKAADSETLGGHPVSDFALKSALPAGGTDVTQINVGDGITGGGTGPTVTLGLSTTYLQTLGNSAYAQLAGNNTMTGTTTFTAGKLKVGSSPVLSASNLLGSSPVTVTSSGGNVTVGLSDSALVTLGDGVYAQLAAANTFTKPMTFASGQTFPGTVSLAGTNTFTGANTFSKAITFASGQTFPGTGSGTITGITTTSPLSGSGTSGSVALSLNTSSLESTLDGVYPQLGASNTFSGSNTFSKAITFASGQTFPGTGTITGITTTSPLSGSGSSGSVALSLNTSALETTLNTIYPSLSGNDTFSGTDTFSGSNFFTNVVSMSSSTAGSSELTVANNSSGSSSAAITAMASNSTTGFGLVAAGDTGVSALGTTQAVNAFADANIGVGVNASGYVGVIATGSSSAGAALDVTGTGVQASGSVGVYATSTDTNVSQSAIGVYGLVPSSTAADTAVGVWGESDGGTVQSTGVYGSGEFGVFGVSAELTGVVGQGYQYGVAGQTTGAGGGVYGWGITGGDGASTSTLGSDFSATSSAGVWGDFPNGTGPGSGVLATADTLTAMIAVNNSPYPTMEVYNYTTATHSPVFETYSPNAYSTQRHCTIDTSANLTCSGVISDVVHEDGGAARAIYSVASADNWIEDAGAGQLSAGHADVVLDPAFAGTVNTGVEYHVFLTPKGDCKGLYVANETADGFEVRELGGGKSSIAFDYRIMAKRKGYETVRLEDLTAREEADNARMAEEQARRAAAKPVVRPTPQHLPKKPGPPMAVPPRRMPVTPAMPAPHAPATRAAIDAPQK